MSRAISQRAGNPASGIVTEYDRLMGLDDHDALRLEAMKIANAGGISAKNKQTFLRTVSKSRTVTDLKFYLTNFVLRADGLGVIS